MICKYPPIEGGVSADAFWTANMLAEMGHNVQVLTNAEEVEENYRIALSSEDRDFLAGFRIRNLISVYSTRTDLKHFFVPQVNPSVSKLVSLGLDIARATRPDLIWAHYVEPYGVAALLISKLTGVPFAVRHAGSDIGRLMMSSQLKPLYEQVFINAAVVMTGPEHSDRFRQIGVAEDAIASAVPVRVPADVFYPRPPKSPDEHPVLGIYGKVGAAKGTWQLIEALSLIRRKGLAITLKALWGGKEIAEVEHAVANSDLGTHVYMQRFQPHWRIPAFLWSCDFILFLEHTFPIPFHGPSVPLEALCCGRPLLTTEEIEQKQSNILKRGINCATITSSPLDPGAIADGILQASSNEALRDCWKHDLIDSKLIELNTRKKMAKLLNQLEARI